ncbi:MAG: histidine phosphatase family protein [Planctomycetota bacterium]|nr:histidine phosphatase family protein [Planctomycetota bacterium]
MLELYLIRHGETEFVRAGKYGGWTDIPLNGRGRRQAMALRRRLRSVRPDAVYSSDLRRSMETAALALPKMAGRIRKSRLLRELRFGEWEGLTYKEISRRCKRLYARWLRDPASCAPPGGETLLQLQRRIRAFMKKLGSGRRDRRVAVFSHGGPIRMILCGAVGAPLRSFFRFAVRPAGVSIVEVHGATARVMAVNGLC